MSARDVTEDTVGAIRVSPDTPYRACKGAAEVTMRAARIARCALLASSFAVACAALFVPAVATAAGTSEITGKVTAASGGAPIDGIEVCALSASGPETEALKCPRTNANGEYVVSGMVAGSYVVEFSAGNEGPLNYVAEYYGGTNINSAHRVDVETGKVAEGVDAALNRGGEITGKVTEAVSSHAPLAHMEACVREVDHGGALLGTGCAETNAGGEYTITGLPSGEYNVEFSPSYACGLSGLCTPGSDYLTQYYSNQTSFGTGTSLIVEAGKTVTGIDAEMHSGGQITGKVTNSVTHAALPNIEVCADPTSALGDEFEGECVESGSGGEYALPGLPTSEYTVRFSPLSNCGLLGACEPLSNYISQYYDGATSFASASAVSLEAGKTVTGVDAEMHSGGQISGKVTNSATHAALPSIEVCAYEATGNQYYPEACAETGSEGDYTISGLPTGDYKVALLANESCASTCAQQNYITQYYNGKASLSESEAVSVTAGATHAGIDAQMAEGGEITGKVTSAAGGALLEGVQVCTETTSAVYFGHCATTNASGEYTIFGLQSGSYKIQFSSNGNYLTQYYDGKASYSEAEAIAVNAGKTAAGINAVMKSGGEITGKVTDASTKAPIANIQICADATSGVSTGHCATTSATGEYTVDGLESGSYTVEFFTYGLNYVTQYYSSKASRSQAEALSVTAGASRSGIDAQMVPGGEITGKVTNVSGGAAIEGVQVCPEPTSGMSAGECATTDAKGEYTILGLESGSYKVEFSPGYVCGTSGSCSQSNYLPQYYDSKTALSEAESVTVGAGEVKSGIDAAMQPGGQITGKVIDASTKAAIAGIEVEVDRSNGSYVSATSTNSSGEYTIGGLESGSYKLRFYSGEGSYEAQYYNGKATEEAADPVNIEVGKSVENIDAAMQRKGEITGKVTDSSTKVALAGIQACAYTVRSGEYGGCATTNSNGEYTIIGLHAGSYNVEFYSYDLAYLTQYFNGKATEEDAESVSVELGKTAENIDAAMQHGGEITGKVTDSATKAALTEITVCPLTVTGSSGGQCATTNSNGEYTIAGLATGSYKVEYYSYDLAYLTQYFNGKASEEDAASVSVEVGKNVEHIDAAMQRGGEITGKVTDASTKVALAGVTVCPLTLTGNNDGQCASTNSNGEYTITGLTTGSYKVEFYDNGLGYLTQYYNDMASVEAAGSVSVEVGKAVDNINAAMQRGGEITGVVSSAATGALLTSVDACALAVSTGEYEGCATTNAKGEYKIAGLAAGSYRVEFTSYVGFYEIQYYNDKATEAAAGSVSVEVGKAVEHIDAALHDQGEITGTVTVASTKAALAGVTVCPLTVTGSFDGGCATTNTNGEYTIVGLATGSYKVEFISPKGIYEGQYYDGKTNVQVADSLSVEVGRAVEHVDAELQPSGRIAGRVTEAFTEAALPGIEVCPLTATGSLGGQCATTNSNGEYTIVGLATGSYKVKFSSPLETYEIQFYNAKATEEAAESVSVEAGKAAARLDAVMQPAGRIAGKVTDSSTKAAIAGVDACAYAATGSEYGAVCATSNASGEYKIGGLATGSYKVEFYANGTNYLTQYYNGKTTYEAANSVSVEVGHTAENVDAQMQPAGAVTGEVTDSSTKAAIAGVDACAYAATGSEYGAVCATSNASGEYKIVGLATGSYKVEFHANGTNYLTQYYNGKTTYEAANSVSVEVGHTAENVDAQMQPAGAVTGKVTDSSTKAAVAGVYVCAYAVIGGEYGGGCATTNSSGEYRIVGLTAGAYKIEFYASGLNYLMQYYNNKPTEVAAESVNVELGKTLENIDAAMQRGGEITGYVTSARTDAPLASVEVCAYAVSTAEYEGCAATNSSGEYKIVGLSTGSYRVDFHSYEGTYDAQYYSGQTTEQAADAVNVEAGHVVEHIDAALHDHGEITGKVTDSSTKAALDGISVCPLTVTGSYGGQCATTNSSGEYTIVGLTTGSYKVEFSAAGTSYLTQYYNGKASVEAAEAVSAEAGHTVEHVDAEMQASGQITGKVTDAATKAAVAGIYACPLTVTGSYGGQCATTNSNGEYTITGLATGSYKVEFYSDARLYETEYYRGKASVEAAEIVDVEAAHSVEHIDAEMQSEGEITGKVTDASTKLALAGVIVCPLIVTGNNDGQCASTNSNGEYTITGLTTGSYKVEFYDNGLGYLTQYYNDMASVEAAGSVSVEVGKAVDNINAAMQRGGEITGVVSSAATGALLTSVDVCAYAVSTGEYGGCATTNAEGEYKIAGLAAGSYTIEFDSYVGFYEIQYYNNKANGAEAEAVAVAAGGKTSGINAALHTLGEITGEVTNGSTKAAIAGITVCPLTVTGSDGGQCTATNAKGEYTIVGLASGTYKVEFLSSERLYEAQYYNGKASVEAAEAVSVETGHSVEHIDAEMQASGQITGKATDAATKAAVAGIYACPLTVTGSYAGQCATTNSNGEYTIVGLATGSYKVEFYISDNLYQDQYYPGKASVEAAEAIGVQAGKTVEHINAELQASGKITGEVIDAATKAAVAGIYVCPLTVTGGYGGQCVTANSNGEYTIVGLATGSYEVDFYSDEGLYETQYYNGKESVEAASSISVEVGKIVANINAELQPSGRISGKVTDASSKAALTGATACPVTTTGSYAGQCATTNSNGEYTIVGLATGSYKVEFSADAPYYLTQYFNGKGSLEAAEAVSVQAGKTVESIDAAMQPAGKITGKVTDAATKAALAGATVCPLTVTGSYDGQCATTNSNGEYTIVGLAGGSYKVQFELSDHLYETQFYAGQDSVASADAVPVEAGKTVENIDAEMQPAGRVSGKVTDAATKAALAGATVCPLTVTGSYDGKCATTNSNGEYTIVGLATGSYKVEFSANGTNYLTQYYNGKASVEAADTVNVEAGKTVENINAELQPAGKISGKVTDAATKAALAGATVCPLTMSGGYDGQCATTNPNGEYTIVSLATGSYKVEFYATDHLYEPQYYQAETTLEAAEAVSVQAGKTVENIDAELQPSGKISGKVTDAATKAALAGATVCPAATSGSYNGQCATTNSNGEYTIVGLATGSYKVEFSANGTNFLTQYYKAAASFEAAEAVSVQAGKTVENINAELQPAGKISGKVTDASSKAALAGATVCPLTVTGSYDGQCATTNSNGEYTIVGLATGSYKVQFEIADHLYEPQDYDGKTSVEAASSISVEVGKIVANINAELQPSGRISGKVTDASSKAALTGATACPVTTTGSYAGQCATTNSNGEYTIVGLATGSYKVEFSADAPYYLTQYFNGKGSLEAAEAVSVQAGKTVESIDAAMQPAGKITGKVTDAATKAALAGATVCPLTVTGSYDGQCATTNSNGEYTIVGLAGGSYKVQFELSDHLYETQFYAGQDSVASADAVPVEAGKTVENIDAEMQPAGRVSGKVTDAATKAALAGATVCPLTVTGSYDGKCATTNSNGEYTIVGLATGSYKVEFSANGTNYLTQYYNGKASVEAADTVNVEAGKTVENINAELQPAGKISGKVTDAATKAALAGATVCPLTMSGGYDGQCATTNPNGEYTIVSLATGSYKVEFSANGANYVTQYYNDKASVEESDTVNVEAGKTVEHLDAAMQRGGEIAGKVTDAATKAALAGITACPLTASGTNDGYCATTNAKGEYTLAGLASGIYKVRFYSSEGTYQVQYYNAEATAATADVVNVETGHIAEHIDAEMQTAGKISGKVTDASTKAELAGATVCPLTATGSYDGQCATTNAKGEYTIGGLASGTYKVKFYSSQGTYETQYYDAKATVEAAVAVNVETGKTVEHIDAEMHAAGDIAGFVTDATTKVALSGITACPLTVTGSYAGQCATTNAKGGYTIVGLPSGSYKVEFYSSEGTFESQLYDKTTLFDQAATVKVTSGGTITGVDAAMQRASGHAPVAGLEVTPDNGPAGLDTTATVTGSDTNGETLYYELQFGDGSSSSGALPVAPITHTYAEPGVYEMRLVVSNGREATTLTHTVTVTLPEPLQAKAGDNQTVVVGEPVALNGADSRPLSGITAYKWEFGDGSTGEGVTAEHVYTNPGEYQAKLTVLGSGQSASGVSTIHVLPHPGGQGLAVTVESGGLPLSGAEVLVVQGDGTDVKGTTNIDGVAHLYGLPDGSYEIYADKGTGYLPANGSATVANDEGTGTIELKAGEPATAELKSHPMTLTEIEEAGINPADPANQHVFIFTLNLQVEPVGGYGGYGGGEGDLGGCIDANGFISGCGSGGGSTCSGLSCVWYAGGAMIYTTVRYEPGAEAPILTSLVIPFKASFLKEFFDVSMIVNNLASAPFTLKSGHATISLPGGMSLAPTAQPQALTTDLPDIPGGGSATAQWILRGDVEGEYNLAAAYAGSLEPFGRTLNLDATTAKPIHVWGASALTLTAEVDKQVQNGYPFHAKIGLTNVADVPVYDPTVELLQAGRHGYIDQPRQQETFGEREVKPGETYWAGPYILVPEASGEVDLAKSFIKKIGGDVSLQSTIVTTERVPSIAETPQVKGHRRNDHTITLEWDPIKVAGSYEIYKTPNRKTNFPETPDPNVKQVGPTKAVITDAPEATEGFFAISSVINGEPTMVHPLISSNEVAPGHYPNVQITDRTSCESSEVSANVKIDDPDFAISSWRYRVDGGAWTTGGPLVGSPAEATVSFSRSNTQAEQLEVEGTNSQNETAQASATVGQCNYIALGDSYSSGEGVPPFEAGTNTDETGGQPENRCHRSEYAYPHLVLNYLTGAPAGSTLFSGPGAELTFKACSGASTQDVLSQGQYGEPAQVDAVTKADNLVTVSVGGDDEGAFAKSAKECVLDGLVAGGASFGISVSLPSGFVGLLIDRLAANYFPSCAAGATQRVHAAEAELKKSHEIRHTFEALRENAASEARIIALDYPPIFPSDPSGSCSYIRKSDVQVLHRLEEGFDSFVMSEIAQSGVNAEVIDLQAPSKPGDVFTNWAGHDICAGNNSWFNGLSADTLANMVNHFADDYATTGLGWNAAWEEAFVQAHGEYLFHPNALGQDAMAQAVIDKLGTAPAGSSLTIHQGQTVTSTVLVPAGSSTLDAGASWPGSVVTMKLEAPNGEVIDSEHVGAGIERSVSSRTEQYVVEDPEPGTWHVTVKGVEIAPIGEPVNLDIGATPRPTAGPPIAAFTQSAGYASEAEAPRTVEFDASASAERGGEIVGYHWSFGDGTSGEGATPTHVFDKPGAYEPVLTVTDSNGATATYTGEPIIVTGVPHEEKGPEVKGTPGAGQTLTCSVGMWAGYPAPTFTYHWLRDGDVIRGEEADSYAVQPGDEGHSLSCEVDAHNSAGAASATSSPVSVPGTTSTTTTSTTTSTTSTTRVMLTSTGLSTGPTGAASTTTILTSTTSGTGVEQPREVGKPRVDRQTGEIALEYEFPAAGEAEVRGTAVAASARACRPSRRGAMVASRVAFRKPSSLAMAATSGSPEPAHHAREARHRSATLRCNARYAAARRKSDGRSRLAYGSVREAIRSAGIYAIRLRPSARVRKALEGRKSATVRVALVFVPVGTVDELRYVTTIKLRLVRHR